MIGTTGSVVQIVDRFQKTILDPVAVLHELVDMGNYESCDSQITTLIVEPRRRQAARSPISIDFAVCELAESFPADTLVE